MEQDIKLLQNVKRLMIARYPRFAQEIANANLQFKIDLPYHTAATDGKNIYFDPDFLANLSDDDKLFIIAHELMHIKFEHMFRMAGKNGQMRDPEIWNIATDAIINANLERDGFKIKEGYVNMPEALNYNAEEFYEKLLKEKRQQNQQSGNGQNQNRQNGQQSQTGQGQNQNQQNGQNANDNGQNQSNAQEGANEQNSSKLSQNGEQQNQSGQGSNGQIMDDHSLWEKAFEESKQSTKGQKQHSSTSQAKGQTDTKNIKLDPNGNKIKFEEAKFDEKSEFQENRTERREIARQRIERMKNEELKKSENGNIEFGEVGEAKAILDWKLLLRREIEKTETIWSQRRSIAENNYAYRLEENDIEDEAQTEVMIDVSGSVSLEMVKAFLRQLKPILKESKLRVGCFNEKYWGMVEIKSNRDIDNFKIPQAARGSSAWTEDWDLAVRSFTKKREINKIVFTDGEPCPGTMPKTDLKGTNVIWLVYSNRNFSPCCGKVIQISERDLQNLSVRSKEKTNEDELTM